MEQALAQAFLEQCPECQWIGGRDGVLVRAYGSAAALFGRPLAELNGRPLSQILSASAAALWRSRFDRVLGGETLHLRERRGKGAWYITMYPVKLDGEDYAGGLAREITPLDSADQELRNAVLSALKAQEFERAMVSKFLHDNVGQNVTALGLQLDLLRMDLENVAPVTCNQISEIQKVLELVMEDVRNYSYELNPSTVERSGLRSALDRLASRLKTRYAGAMKVQVDPSLTFEPKLATALFHILQEAAENAVQHSACSTLEISVKSSKGGPILEVRDDGRGFDPADLLAGSRGLGLLSMEHHAAQAGLHLTVISSPGSGTTVRAIAEKS